MGAGRAGGWDSGVDARSSKLPSPEKKRPTPEAQEPLASSHTSDPSPWKQSDILLTTSNHNPGEEILQVLVATSY
jgi:hypothetical protein